MRRAAGAALLGAAMALAALLFDTASLWVPVRRADRPVGRRGRRG